MFHGLKVQKGELDVPGLLLCLSFFLKPFYILPSGMFQLGDFCLIIALLALIIKEKSSFRIEKIDLILALFVVCVIVVNAINFSIYGGADFLVQTVYYIFNLFAVVLFRKEMQSKAFMDRFSMVLRVDIYLQVFIFLAHLGRWYGGNLTGGTRYMGTFNDPNQLAFFIFCCYVFIQISHIKTGSRTFILDEFAALFVILQTASTGMLAGFCLVLFPKVLMSVRRSLKRISFKKSGLFIVCVCLAALIPGGIFYVSNSGDNSRDTFVLERIEQKFQKVLGTKTGKDDFNDSIIADRQLDKLLLYPEKILYGAGQGNFERFDRAISANEIHSSFPGMLFYYGIGPFVVLLAWVFGNFKRGWNNPYLLLIFFAYFAETFTLTNQRQPLFWMMIVLASLGHIVSIDSELQDSSNVENPSKNGNNETVVGATNA